MSSTKRGATRAAGDFYETPAAAAEPVMRELAQLWGGFVSRPPRVLDAGAGRGALTRAARAAFGERALITAVELSEEIAPAEHVGEREIAERDRMLIESGTPPLEASLTAAGADLVWQGDYLHFAAAGRGGERFDPIDVVVSNPPFELALEFLTATLDVQQPRLAAFLLRLGFLGSDKRAAWWRQHEPQAVRVLSSRPAFDGPRECGRQANPGRDIPACSVVWDRTPAQRKCPKCGWRDAGDSADYGWFVWARGPATRAELGRRPIGWY